MVTGKAQATRMLLSVTRRSHLAPSRPSKLSLSAVSHSHPCIPMYITLCEHTCTTVMTYATLQHLATTKKTALSVSDSGVCCCRKLVALDEVYFGVKWRCERRFNEVLGGF
jgi:hypothetical protein